MTKKDLVYYILLSVIWGTSLSALKLALNHGFSIYLLAGLRFILTGLCLLPFILFQKKKSLDNKRFKPEQGDFHQIIVLSFLMFTIPYILLYVGLEHLPSGIAGIIGSTIPLFTMLFAHFFIKDEKFSFLKILGLTIGLSGMISLVIIANSTFNPLNRKHFIIGFIFYTLSSLFFGIANVAAKKMIIKTDSKTSIFYQTLISGIILFALSFFLDKKSSIKPDLTAFLSLGYISIFGTALSFALYYPMINRLGATKMSTIELVSPFVTIVAGYFLLNEIIDPLFIISGVLILAGVSIILSVHPKVQLSPFNNR